jgi:hypothetical protein
MALLGDLLGAARRDSSRFVSSVGAIDPAFARGLAEAARQLDLDPGAFVRLALSDFSRLASEEDWATLMSGVRDSADPAMTCLAGMVHWRMSAAGCQSHDAGTV